MKWKMKKKLILIFGIIFLVLPLISSLDSELYQSCGGDNELVIDCLGDEELFFIGQETSPVIPPPTPDTPGGGGTTTPTININVTPTEFNINLALGTKIEKTITVKNLGTTAINISIKQTNLEGLAIPRQNSLYLLAGETKTFDVAFIDKNQTGIFTGKIIVGNKQVLVTLNIKTKLLLFDSNIVVLNKGYQVPQGDVLKTQVTLIPMGDPDRLDLTLNYEVKDYEGKVYLTQSETLLVEKQVNFKKNFDTGGLPIGEYIVGLELIYPNGVAPSSAHFEIITKIPIDFANLIFYLIIAILIIAILLVIMLIKKRGKESSQKQILKTNSPT